MFFNKIKGGLFFVLLLWQVHCQAQDVKMYSGKAPSAAEMGEILFSRPDEMAVIKADGIKMRSISFGKPKNSQQKPADTAHQQQNSSIGLPIKFKYDSAVVLDESRAFLNEVGKMLKMPSFANEKLIIEGHTDAVGPKKYNQKLSERRAGSVKTYLKDNFNIAENRLFVSGMGESQPLANINPYAPVNRRVQFRRAP